MIYIPENCSFPEWDFFLKFSESLPNRTDIKIYRGHYSRQGRELIAFAIGRGKKVIGITSGAHADEPVGVLTQSFLLKYLLSNIENNLLDEYIFLCHPIVDPDGYVLNSKWFNNPINFSDYSLFNFRNNMPDEDCEHGIPCSPDQVIRPEMNFIKNNIDNYAGKFEYYVTLHSSHILPGACFVFDKNNQDHALRKKITEICKLHNLPMMDYKIKGDDSMTYLGPGFIGAPTVQSFADHYKNQPEILKMLKMSTFEYAQHVGGAKTAYISELPMWLSTGFDDYSDSNLLINDLKNELYKYKQDFFEKLNLLKRELDHFDINQKNPWYESLNFILNNIQSDLESDKEKLGTYQGFAQNLEAKELPITPLEYQLRISKLALMSIHEISHDSTDLDRFKLKYTEIFNQSCAEYAKKMGLKHVPLEIQVKIQLGLVLVSCSLNNGHSANV